MACVISLFFWVLWGLLMQNQASGVLKQFSGNGKDSFGCPIYKGESVEV